MNNHFSYLRKVVCILAWPILVGLGQFLIVAILSLIFMQNQVNQMRLQYPAETDQQLIERVSQLDLSQPLNDYIESHMIYTVVLNICLLLPFFIHVYRKYKTSKKIKNWNYLLFFAPIAFTILFHIPLIIIGVRYHITSSHLWIMILSEGIVGPIIEEYLFRGIVYHKLKELYPKKNAMVLCTIIFALFHGNLIKIIFAAFLGTLLILLYERYQDIKVPIVFHVIVNLVSLLLIPYLQELSFLYILFVSIIGLVIFGSFCYKEWVQRT